ncbi:MAG: LD-carboxypeptidase [Propionicimonas sp.]|uniref:S66 family peptidase n=1 Tax=Propionicimonas sp. TaxID=1955623 RepID=UPI003D11AD6A
MDPTLPPRLHPGSHIRVIAPARSRAMVLEHDHSALIERRLGDLGFTVSYGAHVDERDRHDSSSVASRLADLHAAFADPDVDGVLTVIGGFNSNELLPGIDYDLIAANPKVLCGYSDITALQNALLARSGLVSYSGPHWSSFGMRDFFDDTLARFTAAVMDSAPIELRASDWFTDDLWFLDQDDRTRYPTGGWWELQPGVAEGRIVGGNLCTLNLLQGTPFMPSLDGALLFVEDDELTDPVEFRRDLFSLLQLPDAPGVTGLVIGRFQRASNVTREDLADLVAAVPALHGKPVLANADFGHTNPQITFPIGGRARLAVGGPTTLTITH